MAKDPTQGPVSQYDPAGQPVPPEPEQVGDPTLDAEAPETSEQPVPPVEEEVDASPTHPDPEVAEVLEAQVWEHGPDMGTLYHAGREVAETKLMYLLKDDLTALAEEEGVEVKSGWTKAEISEAVLEVWQDRLYGRMELRPPGPPPNKFPVIETPSHESFQPSGQPDFQYDPTLPESARVQRAKWAERQQGLED